MGQQENINQSPKTRIQETALQIARDHTQRFPGKRGGEAKLAVQAPDRERETKFNEGVVPQMNA